MPSNAFTQHLHELLADAIQLGDAHTQLSTGNVGRQYNLDALNRAMVVMSVSAWESYLEELMRESLNTLRPPTVPAPGHWQSLSVHVTGLVKQFNAPDTQKTNALIDKCIGLSNVRSHWSWRNNTPAQATRRLEEAMRLRHEIAHGVNPRPAVHNYYSDGLPDFFRRLARCTDDAVRDHLIKTHGVAMPWPA